MSPTHHVRNLTGQVILIGALGPPTMCVAWSDRFLAIGFRAGTLTDSDQARTTAAPLGYHDPRCPINGPDGPLAVTGNPGQGSGPQNVLPAVWAYSYLPPSLCYTVRLNMVDHGLCNSSVSCRIC